MFTEHLDYPVLEDPAVAKLLEQMPALALEFAQFQFVPRRGWLVRNAPEECDLNGEHTTKAIWAARHLPAEKLGLNADLMVELLFFHDFPEKMGYDITIHDASYPQKKSLEIEWCKEFVAGLGINGYVAADRWSTYDRKQIDEARWAGQLDKIDCLVHAKEKEKKGYDIAEFIETSRPHMTDPFPQWLHFKLRTDTSDQEPYLLYKELLLSFDDFELSHNRYSSSDAYHIIGYPEYLETYEHPELKIMTRLSPLAELQEIPRGNGFKVALSQVTR